MNLPERISWALARLAIQPTHQILEIGYGAGMETIKVIVQKATASLQQGGFGVESTTFQKKQPAPVCCVVSRPFL